MTDIYYETLTKPRKKYLTQLNFDIVEALASHACGWREHNVNLASAILELTEELISAMFQTRDKGDLELDAARLADRILQARALINNWDADEVSRIITYWRHRRLIPTDTTDPDNIPRGLEGDLSTVGGEVRYNHQWHLDAKKRVKKKVKTKTKK